MSVTRFAALLPAIALAACVPPAPPQVAQPVARAAPLPPRRPLPPVPQGPPAALERSILGLAREFDGIVGVAVSDVRAGWTIAHNGDRPMPQQSVSKLWVALTLLDQVDRGAASLDDEMVIRRSDLTVFHQPIRALVGADGYRTTVADLLERAMTQSDNTANDALLRKAGGPAAVRGFLARNGLGGIGFGPGERLLQAETAGLTWKPDYAQGNAFIEARAALPLAARQAALDRYVANPIDGARPAAVVAGLAKLARGELLSPASTRLLLETMARSKTGPQRLKAGVPLGWGFAHKTGTGQELGAQATGYNDVALLTAPDGRMFAVAVMIASTRRTIPERQRLMAAVTRAVVADWASGVRG